MADDLPQPWCAYARLQSELSESRYINNRSWGNEAALNCFLVSDPTVARASDADISRSRAAGARRERSRARWRRAFR